MAFAGSKLSLNQTAINTAGNILQGFITAGLFKPESHDDLAEELFSIADRIVARLEAVREAELEETPAPVARATSAFGGGRAAQSERSFTPEQDAAFVLGEQFKKHAGQSIADVYAKDPEYIKWLAFKSKAQTAKGVASRYLASIGVAA